MNKDTLKKQTHMFIDKYKIKPCDFVVGAGGACMMYGLRTETRDIDVALKQYLYEELLKSKLFETTKLSDGRFIIHYNEYIDLHPFEEGDTDIIDGVCCYSLERLLAQKLSLNRPKDQEDIKGLRKLIKIKES